MRRTLVALSVLSAVLCSVPAACLAGPLADLLRTGAQGRVRLGAAEADLGDPASLPARWEALGADVLYDFVDGRLLALRFVSADRETTSRLLAELGDALGRTFTEADVQHAWETLAPAAQVRWVGSATGGGVLTVQRLPDAAATPAPPGSGGELEAPAPAAAGADAEPAAGADAEPAAGADAEPAAGAPGSEAASAGAPAAAEVGGTAEPPAAASTPRPQGTVRDLETLLQEGRLRDVALGASAEEVRGLRRVPGDGQLETYTREGEQLGFGVLELADVSYVFRDDRLIAIALRTGDAENSVRLAEQFDRILGAPVAQRRTESSVTWRKEGITVEMRLDPDGEGTVALVLRSPRASGAER